MTRKFVPRLLAAAVTLTGLVAAVTLFAGSSFASGSAAQAGPVNTAPPQISGTAAVGQTLTASTGSWTYSSTPSYTYQWSHCNEGGDNCAQISGATSVNYVVQATDGGDTIRVTVTAHNNEGTAVAGSGATAVVPVTVTGPTNTSKPQIAGNALVGQQLSASTGGWNYHSTPSFTYEWARCDTSGNNCTSLGGASSSNLYTVQSADAGHTLRVTVSAKDDQGTSSSTSDATSAVPSSTAGPKSTSEPQISGTAQVGQQLSASTGGWTYQSAPSFTYQWLRCDTGGNNCSNIGNASSSNAYPVQSADAGHTLRVTVTAKNNEGTSSSTSGATALVAGSAGNSSSTSTAAGAIKLANGKTSIPASSVSATTDRLIVDGVRFTPKRLTSRAPFTAQFHVSDLKGYVVRDALVYALGAPYAWVQSGVEVRTNQDGWATLTITPSAKMPLGRGSLLLFVRARVEGQSPLGGASTRRLVNILIRSY